jgi:hypothetical protein
VQGTTETVQAMQAQFTTFQQSIDQLTQSLVALRQPVVPPHVQPTDEFANDDSVQDNANLLGPNARGRGLGQQARPPPVLGAQRVLPAEDDYQGKPKFSIPQLDGEVMWRITLLGSSGLRHCGVYMLTLKIRRSNFLSQNLMAMHRVGGIILCDNNEQLVRILFSTGER